VVSALCLIAASRGVTFKDTTQKQVRARIVRDGSCSAAEPRTRNNPHKCCGGGQRP